MSSFSVNITSRYSQGLLNDQKVLDNALRESNLGKVSIRHFKGPQKSLINIFLLCIVLIDRYILRRKQITFHLEDIFTIVSAVSHKNILIPNQEWLKERTERQLEDDIEIWCKTKYSQTRLQNLPSKLSYLGFCSRDLRASSGAKNFRRFLHVAGKSLHKGTIPLLNVWKQHPDWPLLTVVSRVPEHLSFASHNIDIISEFIDEESLAKLINVCGVHICPSETEGFGHAMVEGMSVGSLIMTTNAPPMNELVPKDKRFLIDFTSRSQHYFSECYQICEHDLKSRLNQLLEMSIEELEKASSQYREKYEFLNLEFKDNLHTKLENIIKANCV